MILDLLSSMTYIVLSKKLSTFTYRRCCFSFDVLLKVGMYKFSLFICKWLSLLWHLFLHWSGLRSHTLPCAVLPPHFQLHLPHFYLHFQHFLPHLPHSHFILYSSPLLFFEAGGPWQLLFSQWPPGSTWQLCSEHATCAAESMLFHLAQDW